LIYTELAFNFETIILEKVHANATSPRGLELEFDITLHSVPCAILGVDANDPTGQRQSLHLDKVHHVWKHRLTKDGEFIGDRSRLELGSTLLTEASLKDVAIANGAIDEGEFPYVRRELECGSCYGAGEEGECCNTCEDVKRAYALKSWHIGKHDEIEQCNGDLSSKDEQGEGCNVHGKVALSTGGGNLHLAPNRGLEKTGDEEESIFDVFFQAFEQFNVSHTINWFRFGPEYPGHVHQLDEEERVIEDAYGMYQYYIQVR
jgi:endoplasmic reticulum-Golgi intermediate compartment protein 3